MKSDGKRGIIGVLVFALALRVGWAVVQPRTVEAIARLPDQAEYLSLGRNLLHELSLHFFDQRFGQTIWAYRMPGYPVMIAGCGGSVLAVRLLQCLIDTSTVFGVYLLSRNLFRRESAGVFAAALIAVNPFDVYFCGLILSETVFAALMMWGLVLLVSRRFAGAMILLILACYCRPIAIFISPVLIAVAMMNSAPGSAYHFARAIRRGLLAALLAVVCIGVALLPWAWRNHQRLGSWIWTTTNDGITLRDGFNDRAGGASDQRWIAADPAIRSMGEVRRSRYLKWSAWQWIGEHPGQLPLLSLRKILRTWSPVPLSREFGRPLLRIISAAYAVPFDLLCVIGLCSAGLRWNIKLLLIIPAVLVTAGAVMSVGSIRYRLPAEAPLAVLAAAGIDCRGRPENQACAELF